jgi:alpha-glucosidase
MRCLSSLCLSIALATTASSAAAGSSWSLVNEQKSLRLTLAIEDSRLSYQVTHLASDGRETVVIERSPLGITRKDADFTTGLRFVSQGPLRTIDETYTMLVGKQREIHSQALERSYTFATRGGARLDLTLRAMKDGVAFRYGFPKGPAAERWVTGESTGFALPKDGTAWMLPYDRLAVWAPSYESAWQNRIAVGTPAGSQNAGWALPALFHVRSRWVLISEAGMDGTCFGVHLQPEAKGGLYRVRLPEDDETYGVAVKEAKIALPWQSPWRLIVVGETPAAIVETTAVTDLSAPSEIMDTSWIKPGRVSWSWWSDKGSPFDYNRLVPFVDLSSDFGWEYALIDLGWEDMHNGTVEKLLDYAKAKNVGLVLWYNSGGPHNQVYAGLRDRMHLPATREAEMAKLERMGVKGIKVDFMQSDKQYLMQLYIDILRDAAKHHLFVDFHGATVPRGWARTFPNLLTQEGIRGAEQYWDAVFAENAHTYHTIYTYTRNVIGSMDYTPVIFGAAPELQWHKTTNAHELALAVAFESGLQHFVDSVSAYRIQPDYVQKFLKDVPVAWDETRYVAGEPGTLSVLVRRRGDAWYLAALNGLATPQTVKVPLSFLGPGGYAATLIGDGSWQKDYRKSEAAVSAGETLTLDLAGRGGCAARFAPAVK